MKNLIQNFAVAGLLICTACGQQKQSLVVYTTHGKELVQSFSERFEAANPGISVQWLDMGSQSVLDRLRSEKENPQADIWWGGPSPIFMRAAQENLLTPYRPTWAGSIDSIYHDPDDYWYGTFLTPEVIAFNYEKLNRQTAPQDWDDLLLPRWRGRIVIRDPLASGTMRAIFVGMILRFYEQTDSPEQGFAWLRKLDAATHSYAADPTLMYLKVARGEGDVTLWNMPDIMLQRNMYNYPFDYVIPKSGTIVVTDAIGIVAGTRKLSLAKKYYEFVTTQEAFIEQAQKYYRIPARHDIPGEKLPQWMRGELKVMPMNWRLFAEKSAEWMQYWDEHIRHEGK